jgi:hypothetical protein
VAPTTLAPPITRWPWSHDGDRPQPAQRQPSPSRTTAPGAAVDDQGPWLHGPWTSYLPGPETGLKIFAAGLLALTIAIGGLATLAIRRRSS